MKKKRLFQSVRLLLVAMISTLIGAVAVACAKEDKKTVLTPGPESGLYYCDAEGVDYVFTLSDGNQFTLLLDDLTATGEYAINGDSIELTFSKKMNETVAATLEGNTIVVRYKNSEIRFLKKINYTVTYDSKEGSAVEATTVVNGKTVDAPTAPTRNGYIFLGWFTDEAYTTPFTFGTQPVTSDVTLYAQWVPASPSGSEYTVKFNLNYEGAPAVDSVQTVGGQLLSAVTPTRDGFKFGGWYLSANNSGDALTRPAAGYTFAADATVYALWLSADETKFPAPVVTITSTKITWEAVIGANDYEVVITKADGTVVSSSNAVNVTNYNFDFDAAEAGDYIVSVKVKAKGDKAASDASVLYYKNKALDRVTGLTVVNNTLIFTGVKNAEKYLVTVDCGNESHEHTMYDIGDATTYNFSACTMQEGGIKFTVTAQADGYASSVSETYVYNRILAPVGGFYIVEETQTLKWDAVPYATNYFVSVRCGNSAHEHVLVNNGSSTSFSLKECSPTEGGIVINVYPRTEGYNSPAASTYTYNKVMLASPFGIAVDGNVLSWNADPKATSYEIKIGDTTLTPTTNSVDLTNVIEWVVAADYKIQIKAIGDGVESLWSDTFDARYYAMEDSLKYKASTVSWKSVIGVTYYEVSVNNKVVATVENGATSAEIALTRAGTNVITVRPYDAVMARFLAPVSINVYAYTLTFDSRLGSGVDPIYLATGDKIPAFADSARPGYDFSGWYNLPGGPSATNQEYDHEYYNAHNDMIVYAYWTPATFDFAYDLDGGACDKNGSKATYLSDYQWDVPTNDDATVVFGGWYSAENGNGKRYTDENGYSLAAWDEIEGRTVYAYWLKNVLSFTLNMNGTYNVKAGSNISQVSTVKIPATFKNEEGQDVPVTHIGGNAFAACKTLTKISIPNTIDLIEVSTAFVSCTKLAEIDVYEVPGNNDIKYWSSDGALIYTDQQTSETRIYFPVAKSGSFRIPDGVTVIPLKAFASTSIEEIIIPASVKQIDQNAFNACKNLKSVVFEEPATGVVNATLTIAEKAFQNCTALEAITVPSQFTFGEEQVLSELLSIFSGCSKLASIDVSKNNQTFSSVGGVLCDKSGTTILYCPKGRTGDYTIPSGVTTISDNAFEGCKYLTSITVPSHVTEIGAYAFRDCEKVTRVVFQGGAIVDMNIGNYAFYSLDALQELVFENGSKVATLGTYAFGYAKKLEALTIPASMRSIGTYAFAYDSKLKTVAFAENGQDLEFGSKAFYDCTGLTEINLPASVTKLQLDVFDGCDNILNIYVDENNANYQDIDGVLFTKDLNEILFYAVGRKAESYTLPEETTIYGANSFKNNPYLKSLNVTANIVEIKNNAFSGCVELTTITFEASDTELKLGSSVFQGCSSLVSVELPARVKQLGNKLFYQATSLTTVTTLATDITYIGDSAFEDTEISEFAIHDTVTYIGGYAFESTNISEVNLPQGLETLGGYAFSATNITTITLPGTIQTVGTRVFFNCKSLESVTIQKGFKNITDWMFGSCSKLTEITIPNTVTLIGYNAFSSCTELSSITFEKGGTEALMIGAVQKADGTIDFTTTNSTGRSFYQLKKLTSLELPARTTVIAAYSFYQCEGLESITFDELAEDEETVIPSQLKSIGEKAFYGCTALTAITISKTVSNYDVVDETTAQIIGLGSEAFNGCTKLKTVVFEAGGTLPLTIGANAFKGCSILDSVALPARLADAQGKNGAVVEGLPITVFTSCTAMKTITMETAPEGVTPLYSVADGILYADGGATLKFCPQAKAGKVTVPKTVTLIGNQAFQNCALITEVAFDENYEEGEEKLPLAIGNDGETGATSTYVFDYCVKLATIKFPERLTSIGKYAFRFSTTKKSVFTSISIPSAVKRIGDNAFYTCVSLTSLTFAENSQLETIGNSAFYYSKIESVAIPASVVSIGTSVFDGGSSGTTYSTIKTLTFEDTKENPSKLESIGDYAFRRQTKIKTVDLPESLTTIGKSVFNYCTGLTEIVIPNMVTTIGNDAFKDCTGLTTITMPDALETFNPEIFGATGTTAASCTKLKEIKVNDASRYFSSKDGVLFNKAGTILFFFPVAKSTGTYAVPVGTETIATGAFHGTKLTGVTIPTSVTLIEDKSFYGSTTLTTITFTPPAENEVVKDLVIGSPDNTSSTAYGAFEGCTKITKLDFPDRLTEILPESFSSMTELTTINFAPYGKLKSIGKDAFYKSIVETVTIPASLEALSGFGSCKSLTEVKFDPQSKLKTIEPSAFNSCSALTSITLPESLEIIKNNSIQSCTSLTSITIPAGVTELMTWSLGGSSNIESITFASNSKLTTIGSNVFNGLKKLTSITIPSTVTSIGDSAFKDCTALNTVTFENGGLLESIGTSAFSGCSALKSIDISGGTIGQTAFSGCSALETINLAEGVTSLGKKAFLNCSSLKSVALPASLETMENDTSYGTFQGCTALKTVTFAEGCKLTAIPTKAFYGCESLLSIVIPDHVESINNFAFQGCSSLQSVTFGQSVVSAGNRVFSGCSDLTEIFLSGNIETFGDFTFEDCVSLTELIVPASVISLGENPFKGCTGFSYVGVDHANMNFATQDGVLYEIDLAGDPFKMIYYPPTRVGAFDIPNTVTELAEGVFANSQITEIEFPEVITEVPANMFEGCTDLASVTLHDGFEKIGNSAFAGCTKLTSITIPGTVTSIGISAFAGCTSLTEVIFEGDEQGILTIGGNAFEDCAFTSINVGGTIKSIGVEAFKNVPLTDVTFSEGIETISGYIFQGNTSITSVHIPSSLTLIGASAFEGCTALTSITSESGAKFDRSNNMLKLTIEDSAFKGCTALETVVLPKRTNTIGKNVFYGCESMYSFTFEKNDELNYLLCALTVGDYAFYDCKLLTSIEFPETLSSSSSTDATIGKYCFVGTGLTSVKFNNLESTIITSYYINIGNYAFQDLKTLTSIEFPKKLYNVGVGSFSGSGLTSVTFPAGFYGSGSRASINVSAYRAFANCTDLETVTYTSTSGMWYIGESMFEGCTKLKTVTIPEKDANASFSLYEISEFAFKGCSSLETIKIPAMTTRIEGGAFEGCSSLTALEIPEGMTGIGSFTQNVTSNRNPFIGCTNLTLTVAEGQTKYEMIENALYACVEGEGGLIPTELIYVSPTATGDFAIPASVTTIYVGAFANCTELTSVAIPASVTTIYGNPFIGCAPTVTVAAENTSFAMIDNVLYGIEVAGEGAVTPVSIVYVPTSTSGEFTVRSTVTKIISAAFWGCDQITAVELPNGLMEIQHWAFENCTGIASITLPMSDKTNSVCGYAAFAGWTAEQTVTISNFTTAPNKWSYCTQDSDATFAWKE